MPKNDHMAFQVSDMDKSIAFYTEVLGLELMFREHNKPEHEYFTMLKLEGGNLELIEVLDENDQQVPYDKPEVKAPYCPHLCIEVENMDNALEIIKKHNVPIARDLQVIDGEEKWIYFCDPDNNIIEFLEWIGRDH
ncbi:MAG: VOC family protein [Lentisphaeria bacterium]|nr:VOC family protein [Lentisphaeria bacterium]